MVDLDRRASFLLPLSLLGCRKDRSPEAVGAEFVDRYYVERDHQKALEVAADGAAERVRSERALLEGGASAGVGPQPRVYYKLARRQEKGADTELIYALSMDVDGTRLGKQVRMHVRKLGERYAVVFFTEEDLPPSP